MGIGARIRLAREGAGHKVAAKFADRVGVRPGTLCRYELGHLQPSVDVLVRIARVLGVRMEWLATGEGAKSEDAAGADRIYDAHGAELTLPRAAGGR